MKQKITLALAALILVLSNFSFAQPGNGTGNGNSNDSIVADPEWTLINGNAEWDRRAGLQVLRKWGKSYLIGGRTAISPNISPVPGASQIWGDVWKSSDNGSSWNRILETNDADHWPARAYFQAVKKGAWMYVMAGQNYNVVPNPGPGPPFISSSDFFNDVWRSKNGVQWYQMTDSAAWTGRAGSSAVYFKGKLYIMGGSYNDDAAIIGGPPTRVYLNDVWRSNNGSNWTLVTDSANWAPRAGAQVVVKDGYMYMIGGEAGFLCEPFPFCELPYFNDVWRSSDGENWELVTDSADWSPRPGHKAVVSKNKLLVFGGFGLPVNPMDVWASNDGADWTLIDTAPWNAFAPTQIKYDFDAYVVKGPGSSELVYTFGGDRETFDFTDTTNYLNVDNDVWKFDPGIPGPNGKSDEIEINADKMIANNPQLHNVPNPFNNATNIQYELFESSDVQLEVFNLTGQRVALLVDEEQQEGSYIIPWGGTSELSRKAVPGIYVYKLTLENVIYTERMVLTR